MVVQNRKSTLWEGIVELQYAPQAKSPTRVVPVILAGLFTTAIALVGVYVVDATGETNVMGWHANYVLPVGALLVGLVASSGYGIASWVTGLKIRRGLLWTILLLQVLAYFGAQYVAFASRGPLFLRGTTHRLTFPEYFDLVTRSFTWKEENSTPTPVRGKESQPLGGWGYLFVGLEILGFAGGSLIVPAVLMKHPYCELCQIYMKRKGLAVIPASVKARKVKKKDIAAMEAYTAEQQAAFEAGRAKLGAIAKLAQAGDVNGLQQQLADLKPGRRAADKLPARIHLSMVRCRGCNSGHLEAILHTGQGNRTKRTPLDRIDLSPDFVAAYVHPLSAVARVVPAAAAVARDSAPIA